jgi:hypothetical protein
MKPLRPRTVVSRLRGDVPVVDHAADERRFLEQAGEDGLRAGGGVGSHLPLQTERMIQFAESSRDGEALACHLVCHGRAERATKRTPTRTHPR